jgi:hypothetical protein
MKITHAVRLVHEDVARLSPLHQRQLIAMIAPESTLEEAAELVESGDPDQEDVAGLVYVHVAGAPESARDFEGWIHDELRHPSTRISPDGAQFFVAGTDEPVAVRMSQSTWHDARSDEERALLTFVESALRQARVAVDEPARTEKRPFVNRIAG